MDEQTKCYKSFSNLLAKYPESTRDIIASLEDITDYYQSSKISL